MSNDQVNPITLLPTSNFLRFNFFLNAHEKLQSILVIYILFATINLFFSLALIFIKYSSGENIEGYLVMLYGTFPRIVYYVFVFMFGKNHKTFQLYAAYPLPILFSIIITECYIATGGEGKILTR